MCGAESAFATRAGGGLARRVSVADVAAEAKVSVSSVRNYFSRRNLLSAETISDISAAIAKTGFVRHGGGPAKRTHRVGFEMNWHPPTANVSVHPILLAHLLREGRLSGLEVVPFCGDPSDSSNDLVSTSTVLESYRDLWESHTVDAFFVEGPHSSLTADEDPRIAWLLDAGAPFVSFGRPWTVTRTGEDPYCWVDTDQAQGIGLAVEHLTELGHERIAYVGPSARGGHDSSNDRLHGYEAALRRAGLTFRHHEEVEYGANHSLGRRLDRLFGRTKPPTGIVCASDLMAYQVLDWMAGSRPDLRLGSGEGALAVTGFDALPQIGPTTLTLTSVSQPLRAVVRYLLRTLLPQRLQIPSLATGRAFPCNLQLGASTQPISGG